MPSVCQARRSRGHLRAVGSIRARTYEDDEEVAVLEGRAAHATIEHATSAVRRNRRHAAACTPPCAATAVKLLDAYPSVALDTASIAPLLAKDGERLQTLALHESTECGTLVNTLCTKSAEVKSAVLAPGMLSAAVTPTEARLVLRFLNANGGDAFMALTKEIAAKEKGGSTRTRKKEKAATSPLDEFGDEIWFEADEAVTRLESREIDALLAELGQPTPGGRRSGKSKGSKGKSKGKEFVLHEDWPPLEAALDSRRNKKWTAVVHIA